VGFDSCHHAAGGNHDLVRRQQTWDTTRDRMETLEEMFDRTGFFRKFK
jgi:hypothetical protein